MAETSEELERGVDQTRRQMERSINALRDRANPVDIVGQFADYAREGPVAEFLHNLGRDLREYPMPLLLIGAGVAWAIIASATRHSATTERREPISPDTAAANTAPLVGVPGWEQSVSVVDATR
jgi:hypothetical protein